MDEPDHVIAARRHADKALSGSGGDDPVVLTRLAQTEALLAVAAALDRVAEAVGERDASRRSETQSQGEEIAQIRSQYPNAYTPWTAEADAALLAAHQAGHDVAALADTFGRQPSAIRSRLNRLGASSAETNLTADPPAGSSRESIS